MFSLIKSEPQCLKKGEFVDSYPNMNSSALKTCAELMRTGSDLLADLETILCRSGLSQGCFLTLIVINRTPNEEANPSSLAHKVGVTRATTTGLSNGLQRDGLIERRTHAQDRRKIGEIAEYIFAARNSTIPLVPLKSAVVENYGSYTLIQQNFSLKVTELK